MLMKNVAHITLNVQQAKFVNAFLILFHHEGSVSRGQKKSSPEECVEFVISALADQDVSTVSVPVLHQDQILITGCAYRTAKVELLCDNCMF